MSKSINESAINFLRNVIDKRPTGVSQWSHPKIRFKLNLEKNLNYGNLMSLV